LVLVAYGIGMAYPILTTQTRIDVRVDTLVDQQKELKPKVDMMLQETASMKERINSLEQRLQRIESHDDARSRPPPPAATTKRGTAH